MRRNSSYLIVNQFETFRGKTDDALFAADGWEEMADRLPGTEEERLERSAEEEE